MKRKNVVKKVIKSDHISKIWKGTSPPEERSRDLKSFCDRISQSFCCVYTKNHNRFSVLSQHIIIVFRFPENRFLLKKYRFFAEKYRFVAEKNRFLEKKYRFLQKKYRFLLKKYRFLLKKYRFYFSNQLVLS